MNRKDFLKAIALIPLSSTAMKLNTLHQLTEPFAKTDDMPVVFFGHGSPMNAIELNEFSRNWQSMGKNLPRPNAILVISAHWYTKGTFVTAVEKPQTIHDFGGFPQALFDVQYPAPGSPELAKETKALIHTTKVGLDEEWGLDHGTWSVLKHVYPDADVPVVQLSIDYTKPAQYHYDLAKELAALRKKGVLIVGSGNMVHNLRMVAWDQLHTPDYAYDWAAEASAQMKKLIAENNHQALIDYHKQGKAFELAIPTPDHYLPMLYTLGLKGKEEEVSLFNDKAVMGSLTMTSLKIG